MTLLSLAQLLQGKHVYRAEILELLPQVVRLSPCPIQLEVGRRLDFGNELRQRNVEFLQAVLGNVLELGDGLRLPYLDGCTIIAGLARTAIELGKLLAHAVGICTCLGKR